MMTDTQGLRHVNEKGEAMVKRKDHPRQWYSDTWMTVGTSTGVCDSVKALSDNYKMRIKDGDGDFVGFHITEHMGMDQLPSIKPGMRYHS